MQESRSGGTGLCGYAHTARPVLHNTALPVVAMQDSRSGCTGLCGLDDAGLLPLADAHVVAQAAC